MRLFYIFLICLTLFSACAKRLSPVNNPEIAPIIDPISVRAKEIVSSMDNRLLAAQTLISAIDGSGGLTPNNREMFERIPTGGILLFRYNLNAGNDAIRAHLSQAAEVIRGDSGLPPFIAVDHEGGVVYRFRRGVAYLPSAASYWEIFQKEGKGAALSKIEEDCFRSAREINELGINLNFAPVAEYLTANNSGFLISRSYGPDPLFTAEASAAFVRGMERSGVLCVIKHFPGSAGPDPHYSLSVLDIDRAALNNLISPFSTLIKNGAGAIMIAHTTALSVDSKIASLSPIVMGDWLRGELGFEGIIISDDFSMAAAGGLSSEEAAVQSVAAGSDMIIVWTANVVRTHEALISALEDGRLSPDRLRDAAQRIIYQKIRMGVVQ
ncbi:MAG: glycoside hydrolase family 3 protein [Treponema sp.]|jgi:beta-N-acetylhexosaminidase|nr:glycoside hydrolase family 3 protein [Treponema sp.]